MTNHALTTIQNCEDFVSGCRFMGTGGGVDWGLNMLRAALEERLPLDRSDCPHPSPDAIHTRSRAASASAP